MGKQLIIKGADFSTNGISNIVPSWYINYDNNAYASDSAFTSSNKFYINYSEISRLGLNGKQVNFVKINCKKAGVVNIGAVNGTSAGTGYNYNVGKGMNIIYLRATVTLSQNVSIYLQGDDIVKYWTSSAVNAASDPEALGWGFSRIGSTSTYSQRIPCDFGFGDNA